jgi:hypothetical protein
LIKYDINNTIYSNEDEKNDNKENKEKEMQFKLNFATFSNILSVINNLTDFGLGKNFIKQFIDFTKKNYCLTEDQKQQINCLLNLYEEKGTSDKKINNDFNNNKIDSNIKENEENKNIFTIKEEKYKNDNEQNYIEEKTSEKIENGYNINNDE